MDLHEVMMTIERDDLRVENEHLREECRVAAELQIRTGQVADAEIDQLRAALETLLGECCDRHRRGKSCTNVCHAQAQEALVRSKSNYVWQDH